MNILKGNRWAIHPSITFFMSENKCDHTYGTVCVFFLLYIYNYSQS